MNWRYLRESIFRVAGLFQQRRRERDLTDELEFHLAMKVKAGQTVAQANREFGGLERWKEICRDVDRPRTIEEICRDLALALRMLRKSPIFTAVAIVTLTLAIGANTAVFSLMNELMLKTVPAPNATRLTLLRVEPGAAGYAFNYPLFRAIEQHSASLMRAFAFSDRAFNLRTAEGMEVVPGQFVSGGYFAALGVQAVLGQLLTPQDDRVNVSYGYAAVVSNRFWRNRMKASRQALGQKITINDGVFTVVGVLPDAFRGMSRDRAPDVFLPLASEPVVDSPFNLVSLGYRAWWLSAGSLLNPGVSVEQANAFLTATSHQFFEEAPPGLNLGSVRYKISDLRVTAEPGATGLSHLRIRYRKPLTVLMGLVAMVLLVACLNLAILLTARAASRAREMSTRFALGATRTRLMRQLLTESLLLALTGAVLGLAVAPGLVRFLAVMLVPAHGSQFASLRVRPDVTVFAFTAFLSVLATVLAGTLPALRSTGPDFQAIREGSHTIRGAEHRRWWPRLLLALEVGLSLMLATGASLFGYSLVKLRQTPLGFEPHGLIFLAPQGRQPASRPQMQGYRQLMERIRGLTGVENASFSAAVPFSGGYIDEDIQGPSGLKYHFQQNSVGPGYFKTLRTPLLAGREFLWTDGDRQERKVILNSSAAGLLFPAGNAIGHHVRLQGGKMQAEVVGVVADSKWSSLKETDPPLAYFAAMQGIIPGASLNILIRTMGSVPPLLSAARTIMSQAFPDLASPAAMSVDEKINDSLATERVMSTLALFFGAISLLITGIGLYGTLAYSTERRTGEIGIRVALGAERRHVISTICAENGLITACGCVAGIAGSLIASKTIESFIYGVSPHDPVVLSATAAALLCVAAVASLIPAVKAANIDPLCAIRYE